MQIVTFPSFAALRPGPWRAVRVAAALIVCFGASAVSAAAQDSVVILRGATGKDAPHLTVKSGRPVGELPAFLTPDQCQRLLSYRDNDLARVHRTALGRAEVDADAAVDMQRLRDELQRNVSISDWIALRDANVYVIQQTVASVRAAFRVAEFLATPTGEPKTLGDIVTDIAKGARDAAGKAIAEGTVDEYRRRMNAAAADLNAALTRALSQAANLEKLNTLKAGQQAMHELLATTVPDLDASINAYRAAARDAASTVRQANDELSAIDATLRTACQ